MKDYIKNMAINLFVLKDVDLNQANVVAAIITVAIGMAETAEIAYENDVLNVLLDEFNVTENTEVKKNIGMSQDVSKALIGFDTDYKDPMMAHMYYDLHKDLFDTFYQTIVAKSILDEQNITR